MVEVPDTFDPSIILTTRSSEPQGREFFGRPSKKWPRRKKAPREGRRAKCELTRGKARAPRRSPRPGAMKPPQVGEKALNERPKNGMARAGPWGPVVSRAYPSTAP